MLFNICIKSGIIGSVALEIKGGSKLFTQKAPSSMFERFLNMFLLEQNLKMLL